MSEPRAEVVTVSYADGSKVDFQFRNEDGTPVTFPVGTPFTFESIGGSGATVTISPTLSEDEADILLSVVNEIARQAKATSLRVLNHPRKRSGFIAWSE